jgi:hypothetical protein
VVDFLFRIAEKPRGGGARRALLIKAAITRAKRSGQGGQREDAAQHDRRCRAAGRRPRRRAAGCGSRDLMGSGDPGWLVAAGVMLGIAGGFVIRLPAFLFFATICVSALLFSGMTPGGPLLAAVVAIVVLQIGYGLGVIGRAALRAHLAGRREAGPRRHR